MVADIARKEYLLSARFSEEEACSSQMVTLQGWVSPPGLVASMAGLDLLGTSSTKPKEGHPVLEHQLHGVCYAAGGSGMSGLGKDEFGGSGSLSACGRVSPVVCASGSEASPLTWREAPL